MNKLNALILSIFTLVYAPSSIAEMYKWVDKEGKISYSDQPPVKDAKELEPPSLNATPAVTIPKKAKVFEEQLDEKATKYTSFKITSPVNDATIRSNEGSVNIAYSTKPALNIKEGHYYSIYLDGKIAQEKLTGSSVTLPYVDRGTHTISAAIKNSKGQTLRKSKTITIHLHRHSILKAKPL